MPKHAESVAAQSGAAPAKPVAFAALRHRDFRLFFPATMLAMMADNIEHVISYWLLFREVSVAGAGGFCRDQSLDAVSLAVCLLRRLWPIATIAAS